ncbi:FHA domain-containing protein [Sanguibacter suarezii]|uniref:FHA domain-containing protein n=1 Tax=Sanguibacter suarezii TaxID=60921 RepID=UPI0008345C20|nr:FHA domain-containing protein [Sanguibacter suarezii]
MARKQTRRVVAPTPVIAITITHDQVIAGGTLVAHDARVSPQQAGAHYVATTVAAALNRPVKATATDPLGRVTMVIHPDGHVTDVEPLTSDVHGPVRAPEVSAFADRGEAGQPRLEEVSASVWPPPPPPPLPVTPDRSAREQAGELELTVTGAPSAGDAGGWIAAAVFSDGQIVDLVETILIGRNPSTSGHAVTGAAIRIQDRHRSISRSHFALGVDAQGVWVHDLGSTNGTRLSVDGGLPEKIVPGAPVRCPDGSVVFFGDHQVSITCAAPPA